MPGTYTYADGDKYEGEWKDDKRHGKGTVTYRDQDGNVVEKYEVRLLVRRCQPALCHCRRRCRRRPHAHLHRPDSWRSAVWQGDWYEGKMHGMGRYVYADGGVFEGQWADSKMSGKGACAYGCAFPPPPHTPRQPPPPSRLPHPALRMLTPFPPRPVCHLPGTYIFPNGNKYEGEWVDDVKEGYGVLVYVNGERYEGYWKHDKAHGKGTLTYAQGDKYIGDWVAGKKHGEVRRLDAAVVNPRAARVPAPPPLTPASPPSRPPAALAPTCRARAFSGP